MDLMTRYTECSNKIREEALSKRKLTYRIMSFHILPTKNLVSPFRTHSVNTLLLRSKTTTKELTQDKFNAANISIRQTQSLLYLIVNALNYRINLIISQWMMSLPYRGGGV